MERIERQHSVEQIFEEAIALSGQLRAEFLAQACQGDHELQTEVESLLRHHELLATADIAVAANLPESGRHFSSQAAESRFGGYKLLRVIGEGGMGLVYEAEQEHPRRRVALKVIRPGFASRGMLRRFEYETDVLARLEHPGIARIYHAGIADAGSGPQPFFAMELVQGKRLDQHVRDARPSTKQRLKLLVEICQAVHHAHTKGVIHRDLKPSNILITEEGQPKILDFGVARAIDSDIQATTLHTESGQLIGTLPYMAPEQAAGRIRELDTSSDVYALGVIAYELLSGKMPYSLQDKPLHEAVRVICDAEPSRLSSIDRSLRGDVETIVQKALEKEKARRYQTAGELGADVKRYLDYEPITARPPSRWYQLAKFTTRNKLLVGGVASIIVVLGLGFVTSLVFALRAERQKREAENQAGIAQAVSQFQSDMLTSADPDKLLGDKVTVLQASEAAVTQLDAGKLRARPLVEAAVRCAIGNTFRALNRYDQARPNLQKSLDLCRQVLPPDHPDVARGLGNLASLMQDQGELAEAEPLFRDALSIFRKAKPPAPFELAQSLNNLGLLLKMQGKLADAEPLYREALDISRKTLPAGHQEIATHVNNLAVLVKAQGRLAEAEPLYREALDIRRSALPADHPLLAMSMNNLGMLLMEQGKLDEAEANFRRALEIRRKVLPAGHLSIEVSVSNLAVLLRAQGRLEEAEPLFREAVEIARKTLAPGHPEIAGTLNNLSGLLQSQGKLAEAESVLRESLEINRKALPPGHPSIALNLNNIAYMVQNQGRLEEAEALFRESLELTRQSFPAGHPHIASGLNNLAMLLRDQGKLAEAEALLREALEILVKALPSGHAEIAKLMNNLAMMLQGQKKFSEAESMFRDSLEMRKKALPAGHPDVGSSLNNLAMLMRDEGKFAEAEPLAREALDLFRKALPKGHPNIAHLLSNLAGLLERQNKFAEAEPLLAELFVTAQSAQMPPKQAAGYISRYGICLVKLGRHAEAAEPLKLAYERLKATNQQNPQFKLVLESLTEVAEVGGRPEEAAKWRSELAALQASTQPASQPTTLPVSTPAP